METSPVVRSQLRLQAAISLLHLSSVDAFADEILPKFSLLAFTIQDACYEVRLRFLSKLIVLLHARKLPPRYNLILFLTVHDPENELKLKASGFAALAFRRSPPDFRLMHFEMIFIRLLHLIAHSADFGLSEVEMKDQATYIRNYIQLIATADNISLLYHLAGKAKTVRDAEGHTFSENLYALSEMANEVIKRHAKLHSWSLPSYPGKVKMPSDIFRPLPSPEAANKILRTTYLPQEIVANVDAIIAEDKPKPERKPGTRRKASASKQNGPGRPRKTRKRKAPVSDEEDEEDNDDADDGASIPPANEKSDQSQGVPSDHDDNEGKGTSEVSEAEVDVVSRRTRSRAQGNKKQRKSQGAKKPRRSSDVSGSDS